MSASLMILIPVMLLGIVGMLCFVGCGLPVSGLGPDFTSYTNTMRANSDCIGYWPLKEDADTKPAAELISGKNGKYIDKNTAMPDTVYPWPQYNVANGPSMVLSAAAANPADPANPDKGGLGDIKFAQDTIVRGDVDPLPNDPAPPACMVVNGCYVEVPWDAKFIPQTTFTVEAWVRVDWTAPPGDPHAWRFVLDMREFSPVTTGFGIFAKADDNAPGVYRWAALVGDGSPTFVPIESAEQITLKDPAAPEGTIFYLALTFDGQALTLFVDGVQKGQVPSAGYMSNAAQVLWIGAGTPYAPRRTQPAGPDPASPLFPFVGAIQDVAIYKVALPPLTILGHFNNGQGNNSE
jgi:hypothetical protein